VHQSFNDSAVPSQSENAFSHRVLISMLTKTTILATFLLSLLILADEHVLCRVLLLASWSRML
jgi:hypothetical protein